MVSSPAVAVMRRALIKSTPSSGGAVLPPKVKMDGGRSMALLVPSASVARGTRPFSSNDSGDKDKFELCRRSIINCGVTKGVSAQELLAGQILRLGPWSVLSHLMTPFERDYTLSQVRMHQLKMEEGQRKQNTTEHSATWVLFDGHKEYGCALEIALGNPKAKALRQAWVRKIKGRMQMYDII